jgi:hypothetical protein
MRMAALAAWPNEKLSQAAMQIAACRALPTLAGLIDSV